MEKINLYKIRDSLSIRRAVKRMDKGGIGFVACVDKSDIVVGIISDGDFRRAVLDKISLEERVSIIMNRKFISVAPDFNEKQISKIFSCNRVKQIPVIEKGRLAGIITEKSFYTKKRKNKSDIIHAPVMIMAGGKGKRLDPFTRILPKPLIPLGEKPVIEIIMDEYAKFGMKKFYISICHKADMIKAFFTDSRVRHKIEYVCENKPLGTAGALRLLKGRMNSPFFVSNCDVIIKENYTHIYRHHLEYGYQVTIVGAMQHHTIPYGVCKIENGGLLKEIKEKPKSNFLVNTGMYILNPEVLSYIPQRGPFDMTDLIDKLQKMDMPVGLFPISADSWVDVGQMEEYKKTIKKINL